MTEEKCPDIKFIFLHLSFWVCSSSGGESVQIYTIVIGGLEKSYMQKLVLYLNERLGKSARVELMEHWEIPEQPEVWKMKKQSVGVAHGGQ